MITSGDFNYVEESIDRTPNINKRDTYVKRIFKPKTLQLIDVFRKCNKDKHPAGDVLWVFVVPGNVVP